MVHLTSSARRVSAARTDDGAALDQRQLKHRARDAIRVVPIPPVLVAILRQHIKAIRHRQRRLRGRRELPGRAPKLSGFVVSQNNPAGNTRRASAAASATSTGS